MLETFQKCSYKKMNKDNTTVYYVNEYNLNDIVNDANKNINKNTLIICNSDFTHYGSSYNNYEHNTDEELNLI
jgi:predicted class III extradiol MEMO1 family dioxygenase